MNSLKRFADKKSNAVLAGTIIIFIVSFLVFCVCSIDAGYTIAARYKTQKITETIALYMASYLNSLPKDKKTEENLNDIKVNFENLYSDYELSGYYSFEIKEINIKSSPDTVKIKVETETSAPSLFLKYAGIGTIKISQNSYAIAEPSNLKENNSDDNSYIYKAKDIITDKKGDDIEIKYNKSYFVFAGLKTGKNNDNSDILWTDIGIFSDDNNKKPYSIKGISESYNLWCISKEDTKYDFSKNKDKTIGLLQYIKIIETNDCENPAMKTEKNTSDIKPLVTVLNSAKIISREKFTKEDF